MSPSDFASRIATLGWALDSSPHLVYAAGADGRIVFVNAAGRTRWGEAATVGAPDAGLFAGQTRGHFADVSAQVLASGEAATDAGEHSSSGVRAWATYTLSPLREGDAITGYLCIATDTTEFKRAELRLRRSEQLMVDTQGVAHLGTWEWDIREPTAEWSDELYQIYGLKREHYTPSYEAYLAMVHPDDRQRVIDALRCNVDASLMRAAMENMIGNAWKYSARVAHARIEIGTMAVDGRHVFFVRDNGAGFDMTQAHRLFAPFQRLHAPNEFDGTGVGLAAVQRIIERHGGRVWGESATGHGATFFFTVPNS